MASSQNFRSAFNGFNREDVVQYLEYINSRHNNLVNQLSGEADALRQKLSAAAAAVASDSQRIEQIALLEDQVQMLQLQLQDAHTAMEGSMLARQELEETCESLRAQLAAADPGENYAALQAELALAQAENARLTQALADARALPMPAAPTDKELAAYRRAERVERMARERAHQLSRQTSAVLTEATGKVDQVAAELGAVADRVTVQLQQLQQAVAGSKQALQAAAGLMSSIHPEGEDL